MDRFIATTWPTEDEQAQHRADTWDREIRGASSRWQTVLAVPGLRVYSLAQYGDKARVTEWEDGSGVVIGTLFYKGHETAGRVSALSRKTTQRIIDTDGAELVARYWGNYLAIWCAHHAETVVVLRDPCGAIPCYRATRDNITLLFSHAEDVASLSHIRFDIDWDYVLAFCHFNYFVTSKTGLANVSELLPGERLTLTAHNRHQLGWAWDATSFAQNPVHKDLASASEALRSAAAACFSAWGSVHKRMIVSLSGGLDSSAVVGLLKQHSASEVVGLHFVGVDYEQYERKLARLAATHADIQLVEVELVPARDEVVKILQAPRLARPSVQSLSILIDDTSTQLAREFKASAFVLGQGGDNLFLQRGGASHILSDYVQLEGVNTRALNVAYDAATLTQRPLVQVTADALRELRGTSFRPFQFLHEEGWARYRLLTEAAVAGIRQDYQLHPWLSNHNLPSGKAQHLQAMIALYYYYINHLRGLESDVLYPLFSQPIFELCLATPLHLLCSGGIDRALERTAFAHVVPPAIARRTGKGGADTYNLQVMKHNMRFYRQLILDGELLKQGWFDRASVERYFSDQYNTHGGGALFAHLMVAAEAWIHTWRSRGAVAGAR